MIEGFSPWDILEAAAIVLDARLHEGVGNPLPKLPHNIGEWLANALGGGGLLASDEELQVC